MRKLAAVLLAVSMSVPLHAQWFDWEFPLVPRTDDGSPDIFTASAGKRDQRILLDGFRLDQPAPQFGDIGQLVEPFAGLAGLLVRRYRHEAGVNGR